VTSCTTALMYSTIQYSTVQYSTVQYCQCRVLLTAMMKGNVGDFLHHLAGRGRGVTPTPKRMSITRRVKGRHRHAQLPHVGRQGPSAHLAHQHQQQEQDSAVLDCAPSMHVCHQLAGTTPWTDVLLPEDAAGSPVFQLQVDLGWTR